MIGPRVIFRLCPEDGEDIFGYLIRVVDENSIVSLNALLHAVFSGNISAIGHFEVPHLSYFCRLYPEEMLQLSGLSERIGGDPRSWLVNRHRITKERFVLTRKSKICTQCFRESLYVRGIWGLTFYTACTRHKTLLIDRCPSCRKQLRWNRRVIRYCSCGCDLAGLPSEEPSIHSLVVASLIEQLCGQTVKLKIHHELSPEICRCLASLSLDGLCKVIWFVGRCVCDLGQKGYSHGRYRPRNSDAAVIIEKAFDVFEGWPVCMGQILERECRKRFFDEDPWPILSVFLGPLERYIAEELQDGQFAFLTSAYEGYLDKILRVFGRQHRKHKFARELEFNF